LRGERGAIRSLEAIALALATAAVTTWAGTALVERARPLVAENVERQILRVSPFRAEPAHDPAAAPQSFGLTKGPQVASAAEGPALAAGPRVMGVSGGAPGFGADVVPHLPVGTAGRALGAAASGAVPVDDALKGVAGPLAGGLVGFAADEAGAPGPLGAGMATAAASAVHGALFGGLEGVDVARAAAGSIAGSAVQDALSDVPVPGLGGAVGGFVNGAIRGGDLEDLGIDAGLKLASSGLASMVGPVNSLLGGTVSAAPIIGPFLDLWTSGLTGREPPGPGTMMGGAVGTMLGGPIGALAGGFVGGLLDGVLGWGKPKSVTLTEKLDLSGDGTPDEVVMHPQKDAFSYVVDADGAKTMPLQSVEYELLTLSELERAEEMEKPWQYRTFDRVPGNVGPGSPFGSSLSSRFGLGNGNPLHRDTYYLKATYNYKPLFPSTGGASTSIAGPEKDHEDSRFQGGYEISPEQYQALTQALGGTKGALDGADPRAELLREHVGAGWADGRLQFRQADKNQGLYFRQDVNGDGAPDLLRAFPKIDGFVDGDNRVEVVELGVPG
jgi:hypothetical protein